MKYFVCFLFLLNSHKLGHLSIFEGWIVWNVGQGQWVTKVERDLCLHFDLGGEFNPLVRVLELCSFKENRIYISHDDKDHVRFIPSFLTQAQKSCLGIQPPLRKKSKLSVSLSRLQLCPNRIPGVDTLYSSPKLFSQNNRNSLVFWIEGFLLPGDSTRSEEKTWAHAPQIPRTRLWLLGHHGSASSTSKILLERLPKQAVAIASSRRAKYNHPHPQVMARLKQKKMPLILTEEWGHLMFEQRSKKRN